MLSRNQMGRTGSSASKSGGFSLIELTVSSAVLIAVSAIVVGGVRQMSFTQNTVQNRTEMHSSVRSATELMQQEIGQAGRVTLMTPASMAAAGCTSTTYTLTSAVTVTGASASPTVSCVAGMYVGEQIVVDTSDSSHNNNQETVTLTGITSTAPYQITAIFSNTHASGAPIAVAGAFASGIVPTNFSTNPSTGTVLKIYGDINDDGNMVYVEYTCDTATTGTGSLYRNVVSLSASSKPVVDSSMVLLSNLTKNNAACFTYQQQTLGTDTYVVDVAITLTVQTATQDLQTGSYQNETKALLNVSPRNVFEVWQMASAGLTNRIQPMPNCTPLSTSCPYNVYSLLP